MRLCKYIWVKNKNSEGSNYDFIILTFIFYITYNINFFGNTFCKKNLKYKNIKYIRLLKIFELITPFIALIVSQGPRQVIGMTFLVFFFLSLTYFGILLYDVFKGKIDGNEFTINFVFYLVDIVLMFLSTLINVKIISLF